MQRAGDTLGGIIEVRVEGVPFGLGSHTQWDKRLDGRLAQAVMAVQAIKGVEIGMGFEAARRRGSEVHDPIGYDPGQAGTPTLGFTRPRNNAGGLEAGMSNAQPIVVRAAKKPISTLAHPLPSVNLESKQAQPASYERSDVSPWRRQAASWRTSSPLKSPRRWSISSAATAWPRSRRDGNCSTKWRQKDWKMIQLHDKTRRRICLAAFVSPLPRAHGAGGGLVRCLAASRPQGRGDRPPAAADRLEVALAGLGHPRPGTVLYRGLTLSDPETGQTVLRCRLLEATWTRVADAQGPTKTVVSLSAAQAEIEADGVHRLGQLLERILQNQGDGSDVEFRLSAGRLTLHCAEGPQTLTDVEGAD